MIRIGEICGISKENAAEYVRLHDNLPAEIYKLLKACNIRNYTIFLRDELLFAYYEYIGDDFRADMNKMAESPDNKKWWNIIKPIMSPLNSRSEEEFWSSLTPIFHID